MDVSDYLPMFLAEARENLQSLNLALVEVEQNPTDAETINQIFRIAHSLKGMSATMGFARMAALTHEMENVMEGMSAGRRAPARRARHPVRLPRRPGADDGRDRGRRPGGDRSGVPRDAPRRAAPRRAREEAPSLLGPPADAVARASRPGLQVVRVGVDLAADVDMPGVRAFLALRRVEDFGDVVHAVPSADAIERGDIDGHSLLLWVATDAETDAIAEAVGAVEGVGSCTAAKTADEEAAAAPPAPVTDTAVAVESRPTSPPSTARPPRRPPRRRRARRRRPRPCASRPTGSTCSCTRWASSSCTARASRQLASQSGLVDLQHAVGELSRVAQALTAQVMQVRMVPVESVFMRFPRMVRDIATKLDKQIDLQVRGEDTELDRTVVEALGDPLVHLVRNAVDHGLERPAERTAAGKPATGVLEISAEHAGGEVVIRVRDDGHGIVPEKIGKVAAERGLIEPDAAAT